jgi:hypothetical protein
MHLQMVAHCLMFTSLLNVLVSMSILLMMISSCLLLLACFMPFLLACLLHAFCFMLASCLQMAAHCLMFASLNVLVSTVAFIPLMLYGLNLAEAGWRPVDAALFGAMLGSTDAVAVTAILKAGGSACSSCWRYDCVVAGS